MISIFTMIAQYASMILMLIFIISCTYMLFSRDSDEKVANYRMNNVITFCLHLVNYAVIIIYNSDTASIVFYLEQVAFFAVYLFMFRKIYKNSNLILLNTMYMLLVVGMIIVARLNFTKATKQFYIMCGAAVVSLIIPSFLSRISAAKKLSAVFGVLGICALGAVLLLSRTTYGANLSLKIAGISVQPSEFVKVTYVLLLAMLFRKRNDWKRVCFATFIAMLHTGILVLSKDLGGALIYYLSYLAILYVATKKFRYPFLGLGILSLGGVLAYFLFSHVRVRVTVWADPWSVIDTSGYQVAQSLFSIAGGSWLGKGLFKGEPNYIPVVEKDFIFSAISEEFGALFAIMLILVCLIMLVEMLRIAAQCKVIFYRLLCVGLSASLAVQTFLTIGGSLKLIPSTGVTLALVSYGGSSLLSTFILIAAIQGVFCKLVKISEAQELENRLVSESTTTKTVAEDGHVIIKHKIKKPNNKQKAILSANDVKDEAQSDRITETKAMGILYGCVAAVSIVYLAIFLIKAPYDTNITENPYNLARVNTMSGKIVRGNIITSDGAAVAVSVINEDGSTTRRYPYDNLFCHIVGYTGTASSGIESLMNNKLLTSTKNIKEQIETDLNSGRYVGDSVVISIHSSLQYEASIAMGDRKGAVVVMDVETGDVLVMLSKPDFNPNNIDEIWANINNYTNGESFLLNRATQGLYPPGSTFKIFTSLSYMRKYPNSFDDYRYTCTGTIRLGDTAINCSDGHVHGDMTITSGLEQSCNGVFANMAANMGNDEILGTCKGLLFNSDLPFALSYKKSNVDITDATTAQERMLIGFGQGKTTVTPLHMCMIASAIANDGILMKPRLVKGVVADTGTLVESYETEVYNRLLSETEAKWLQDAMISVVNNGTAQTIKTDDYISGGKTGSAQYGSSLTDLHSWYFGFAKKDGYHTLAVAVILEGAGSGAYNAAPVAKAIFDRYFEVDE